MSCSASGNQWHLQHSSDVLRLLQCLSLTGALSSAPFFPLGAGERREDAADPLGWMGGDALGSLQARWQM